MAESICILIPAYNEAENLPGLLSQIKQTASGSDVVVIDDGSQDGTSETARSHGAKVITHFHNLGYGSAIQTGVKYALRTGYDCAVLLDGDGQHDPASIPGLAAPCLSGEADLVVGSRFREPRSYRPSLPRRAGIFVLSHLTRLITGLPVTDPTSGFLALNRRAMEQFASRDFPTEYPDANNIIWLHRLGLRISEHAVLMHPGQPRHSMHRGRKAPYYFFFMIFSILVIILRKK